MRSYGQYCPIAKAAEVIGDRWSLLIVRELLFGPLGFNEFTRGLPGISRSVLAARLRYLARVGVVEKAGGPGGKYRLTAAGARLSHALQVLGEWAATWVMTDPTPAELDPELLGLFISRLVGHQQAPEQRVVVSFTLHGPRPGRSWLVLSRAESSICLEDPCLDPARYVYVESDTETLLRVFMGRLSLVEALDDELVRITGRADLVRAFSSWFTWNRYARGGASTRDQSIGLGLGGRLGIAERSP